MDDDILTVTLSLKGFQMFQFKHRDISTIILSFVCLITLSSDANAQSLPSGTAFTYEWRQGGTLVSGTLNVTTPTVTLQLYLRQTAGADPDLLATEHGLFGGGGRVTYGTTGVVNVATTSDISYNPAFNDTATSNSTLVTNTNFAEFRAVSDLSGANGALATNGLIQLGSFNFTVVGSGTTTLTAGTVPVLADTVTYANLLELDPVIQTYAITLSVVPEPTTIIGLAGVIGYAGFKIKRRFKKSIPQKEDVTPSINC